MHVIQVTILLLAVVVVSSFIDRMLSARVPLPFIQILLGVLLSQLFGLRIELEPEIFLLLFIAPLLFLDGWLIPKQGLLRDRRAIVALALGLVLFTVAGAGYVIHWLIPGMPLAVAFALAAVLSPTDAVSVAAVSARVPVPARLMHILEGEALLNDATGLVCMRFAVAAALTGYFSFAEAAATFVWLAVGGVLVGAAVTLAANAAKDWIAARFGEEPGAQILVSLLIPFVAFLIADSLDVSGILAAVAAGIAMNFEELKGRALPITRIRRSAVWRTIQFAVNGVIFVLLGDQFPTIVEGADAAARDAGLGGAGRLAIVAVVIYLALLLCRFLWGWLALRFLLDRAGRRSGSRRVPVGRYAAITSLAGVRGALTLSGVMALPLSMPDGSPFPARDVCIAFAACTIVLSLIFANIGLPPLLRGLAMPVGPRHEEQAQRARAAAATAAIEAVERYMAEAADGSLDPAVRAEAAARILLHYRRQAVADGGVEDATEGRRADQAERQLRIVALGAERDEYFRRARSGRLSEEVARVLVREVDLLESHFGGH